MGARGPGAVKIVPRRNTLVYFDDWTWGWWCVSCSTRTDLVGSEGFATSKLAEQDAKRHEAEHAEGRALT